MLLLFLLLLIVFLLLIIILIFSLVFRARSAFRHPRPASMALRLARSRDRATGPTEVSLFRQTRNSSQRGNHFLTAPQLGDRGVAYCSILTNGPLPNLATVSQPACPGSGRVTE